MEPTTYSDATDHRIPPPVTNQALLVGLAFALAMPAVIVAVSYPVTIPIVAAFALALAARRAPAAAAMWTRAATRLIARGRRRTPTQLRG